MARGGRPKERDISERRCIVAGETEPKAGLIRFVVGPEGDIVPDLAEKLPGRGIWVSADRTALEKAVAKNLFARAAKQAVHVDPELPDRVEELLLARVIETLALARKAGLALSGFEKVKAALVSGTARLLVQASDGSAREKAELRSPQGENTRFEGLSANELGLAFGRDRVIHAALIAGGLTDRVRYESARLTGLRGNRG